MDNENKPATIKEQIGWVASGIPLVLIVLYICAKGDGGENLLTVMNVVVFLIASAVAGGFVEAARSRSKKEGYELGYQAGLRDGRQRLTSATRSAGL